MRSLEGKGISQYRGSCLAPFEEVAYESLPCQACMEDLSYPLKSVQFKMFTVLLLSTTLPALCLSVLPKAKAIQWEIYFHKKKCHCNLAHFK